MREAGASRIAKARVEQLLNAQRLAKEATFCFGFLFKEVPVWFGFVGSFFLYVFCFFCFFCFVVCCLV